MDAIDSFTASLKSTQGTLQDFRPLPNSLDWELGQLYWLRHGGSAFLTNEVPNAIINDGALAACNARLFFSFVETNRSTDERLHLIECGVGSGIFARLFLQTFRELCERNSRPYYERLLYHAVDKSAEMLRDIERQGILDSHRSHVSLEEADVLDPDWPGRQPSGISCVIANYVLDTLPVSVFRYSGGCLQELNVRTSLRQDVRLADHTPLTPAELTEIASSGSRERKAAIIDLYDIMCVDLEFRPADLSSVPFGTELTELSEQPGLVFVHSFGALQFLDATRRLMGPKGIVLINDYPASKDCAYHQHFGGSTAMGVNFQSLKRWAEAHGNVQWCEPSKESSSLVMRMLGFGLSEQECEEFRLRFGAAVFDERERRLNTARARRREGHHRNALANYKVLLEEHRNNWLLLGEVAEYAATLGDFEGSLKLAQAAVDLNPIAPELWNILGDAYFYREDVTNAHKAFQRALELDSRCVRALYNLIYTFARQGDHSAALRSAAEALFHDREGKYRERIIQRQDEILRELSKRWMSRCSGIADRVVDSASLAPVESVLSKKTGL